MFAERLMFYHTGSRPKSEVLINKTWRPGPAINWHLLRKSLRRPDCKNENERFACTKGFSIHVTDVFTVFFWGEKLQNEVIGPMGELTWAQKVPQFSQFSGILQNVLQFSVTFSVFLAGGSLNDHFFPPPQKRSNKPAPCYLSSAEWQTKLATSWWRWRRHSAEPHIFLKSWWRQKWAKRRVINGVHPSSGQNKC